jgi:MYXO-CTERM domain-containing protein
MDFLHISRELAMGNISNIGIMALDGSTANDRMRLENFSITGTAVPEPSAALLGGLGLLALFRRRRS